MCVWCKVGGWSMCVWCKVGGWGMCVCGSRWVGGRCLSHVAGVILGLTYALLLVCYCLTNTYALLTFCLLLPY